MENKEIENEEKKELEEIPEEKLREKSPKKKKKSRMVMWLLLVVIFLLFTFIVVVGFLGYAFLSKTSELPTTDAQEMQEKYSVYHGTITGSLGYPSDFIPPLEVCAENTKTKEEFCTYENIEGSEFLYSVGYVIKVPAGTYNVYAQLTDPKTMGSDFDEDFEAYYSKFVTCGMDISCKSHKKIDVEVIGGEVSSNVDPLDWYDN